MPRNYYQPAHSAGNEKVIEHIPINLLLMSSVQPWVENLFFLIVSELSNANIALFKTHGFGKVLIPREMSSQYTVFI